MLRSWSSEPNLHCRKVGDDADTEISLVAIADGQFLEKVELKNRDKKKAPIDLTISA